MLPMRSMPSRDRSVLFRLYRYLVINMQAGGPVEKSSGSEATCLQLADVARVRSPLAGNRFPVAEILQAANDTPPRPVVSSGWMPVV